MEEGVNSNSPNERPPGFNQTYNSNDQQISGGTGNITSIGIVGQPSAARADLWQQTLQVYFFLIFEKFFQKFILGSSSSHYTTRKSAENAIKKTIETNSC
jgi:hypothetical protein